MTVKNSSRIEEIYVTDNLLPEDLLNEFIEKYRNPPLKYGWKAHSKNDPHGHWNLSFVDADGNNLADISDKLTDLPAKVWEYVSQNVEYVKDNVLLRCYINGHTYGVDGYFHKDSERNDETTMVLYINEEWWPNWAGETVFTDDDLKDIILASLPKKGRAVFFPGNMWHCARGVSRKSPELRKTFMFKTRKKRSPNFERLSQFLSKNGATTLKHKVGTLHDHLMRTFQHLESKGLPEHVCFGGGLHSVFGTNAFKGNIFTSEHRELVIKEFGQEAAELSILFSELNRPKTLNSPSEINIGQDQVILELRDEQKVSVPFQTFFNLAHIECANLLDQKSLNKNKYPQLHALWHGDSE